MDENTYKDHKSSQPNRVPDNRQRAEQLRNPNKGNRFSIFAGDPERIQKANAVNLADFEGVLEISPDKASLSAMDTDPSNNKIGFNFHVRNKGARSYTLSFPDSQRFDYEIYSGDGRLLYRWSQDKEFVQVIGSSFINPGERITFSEALPLNKLKSLLSPGNYSMTIELSNYPEVVANSAFILVP